MPKYQILAPRYIDGTYIFASPESPAEIELPKGTKIDPGLIPIDKAVEKLKPHYADRGASRPDSAAAVFSKPNGGRASDAEPV